MKLEGSLDTFPLRELIDMIVYSSVTGVLNIYGPGEAGQLYFRDSSLYHVERGGTRGVEALADLLELTHARFTFVSNIVTEAETLYGPLATHLQAADRIAARWRQIRAYVPSLDLVPQLLAPRDAAMRRAGPALSPLLLAIDGRSSLRQIAASLAWSTIDVAEAATEMSLDGLVDLQAARSQPAASPHAGHPQHHGGEGIFDRILARTQSREPGDDPSPRGSTEEFVLRALRGHEA